MWFRKKRKVEEEDTTRVVANLQLPEFEPEMPEEIDLSEPEEDEFEILDITLEPLQKPEEEQVETDQPQITEVLRNLAETKPMPSIVIQFSEQELDEALRFYLMAKLPEPFSSSARQAEIRIVVDGEQQYFDDLDIKHIEARLKI